MSLLRAGLEEGPGWSISDDGDAIKIDLSGSLAYKQITGVESVHRFAIPADNSDGEKWEREIRTWIWETLRLNEGPLRL